MLQKYLAFYGASGESTEAFNDYRRLKALGEEDFIGLANPLNAQNNFLYVFRMAILTFQRTQMLKLRMVMAVISIRRMYGGPGEQDNFLVKA